MERLPLDTPWMTAASVRAVLDALEAAGGEACARFVGGCVRDTLLGRGDQVMDVDIATPLTPPQVIAALKAAELRAVPTGVAHGTVTAISEGRPYEITTLRRDVETDGRRAVVAFTADWAEDAQRRDFRLNALYADPDGTLHDPTGGGLADVHARQIVFVGDPETRIREDYLRVLRFFRFLARVGDAAKADPASLAACAKLKEGVATLSGERLQQEMVKLLGAPDPLPAVRLMAQAGVLALAVPGAQLDDRLPALLDIQAQDGIASDAVLRLKALIPTEPPARIAVANRLRLSNADAARLKSRVWAEPPVGPLGAKAVRAAVYRFGSVAVRDELLLLWAGASGAEPALWRSLLQATDWPPPPFPVTGAEIKALGVPEGPQVGAVRKALEAWWVAGDFSADKAEALAELEAIVRALGPA